MKEILKHIGLVSFIAIISWSCRDIPTYPNTPSIEYSSIYYQEGDTTNTLMVEIDFRDGDGDLGLSKSFDNREPYNDIWYYPNINGTSLVTYADRNTAEYDTLPPYEFPYYCTNYSIEESDTFYITQNPNHFNIFVDFYVKKNGQWNLYDWVTAFPPQCGESYNGRFPILNETGADRPLEGSLKYKMAGLGFELIFKRDTLKLEITIQDRALNKSNTVETPEFVIKDIKIN